ncbi:MAG: preprotein translocase subunit YajC [Alphaproteobacteria bacterium]|nr:preprotein translocase subunit YajC [Alphaproteobacteria bacterium]MBM4264928.1 preprotein translocase subunit YajC [Deltaproteobacteria bacterium]
MANFAPWLIVILVFIGAMAFLVVPQLNRMNAHSKFLKTLKVGDRVVTIGGLVGTLTEVDGDIIHIAFANMQPVPILRSAIERNLP